MSSQTQPLIIRFASDNIPDLTLHLSPNLSAPSSLNPSTSLTTFLTPSQQIQALYHHIRAHLPQPLQRRRLRLIVAGRVLVASDRIDQALRLKGKGKDGQANGAGDVKKQPIYLHCVVSSEDVEEGERELERERAAAQAVPFEADGEYIDTTTHTTTFLPPQPTNQTPHPLSQTQDSSTSQLPSQPQGFSRLLSSGFTPQDVAALRAQFRAMTASRYTPDTMPDSAALLRMEERWLNSTESGLPATTSIDTSASDSDSADAAIGGGGGAGMQSAAEEEDTPSAALNDMLLGVIAGFFWPVGAMVWGLREEGVWSRRRGWAVLGGVGVNVAFGVIRLLG